MRSNTRATVVGAILLLSSLPGWMPELRRTREAVSMARRPYEARRAWANGPFWSSLAEVRRRLPGHDPVPVVMRQYQDVDRAVFLTYYLYPRVTRCFWSLDQYRVEAPAPPETPLVYINVKRVDAARVMTYPEIRAEQVAEMPFSLPPLSAAWQHELIVPFVTAYDGAPPDAYLTQAVFVSASDGAVTLTLEPDGRAATFPIRAGVPLAFRDLVYDVFKELKSGWLRVTSTVPLRAGVALVNRGRSQSAPIPLMVAIPPLPRRVAGGDRLWLLNAENRDAAVTVNRASVTLPPHALLSMPSAAMNEIGGTAAVLPFSSRKLPNGNTSFVWP